MALAEQKGARDETLHKIEMGKLMAAAMTKLRTDLKTASKEAMVFGLVSMLVILIGHAISHGIQRKIAVKCGEMPSMLVRNFFFKGFGIPYINASYLPLLAKFVWCYCRFFTAGILGLAFCVAVGIFIVWRQPLMKNAHALAMAAAGAMVGGGPADRLNAVLAEVKNPHSSASGIFELFFYLGLGAGIPGWFAVEALGGVPEKWLLMWCVFICTHACLSGNDYRMTMDYLRQLPPQDYLLADIQFWQINWILVGGILPYFVASLPFMKFTDTIYLPANWALSVFKSLFTDKLFV